MTPNAISITDEVFQVGGYGFTDPSDAAVYLIAVEGHAALVDAGCGRATDLLLANVEAAGVAPGGIELLLLTHCHFDHAGGAAALRARLGCRVVAHALDAPYIEAGDDAVTAANWYDASMVPCCVDRTLLAEREPIDLGGRIIEAIAIPGHSPGSVAYLLASHGQKIVFGQDVHGPLHPSLLSDRADYLASLRRLLELEADILCEGHYGIYEGKDAVARYIRRFMGTARAAQ
jgi:glyoxylase-like metal-dependent hydrolase (beta-lactamase superfamily II)